MSFQHQFKIIIFRLDVAFSIFLKSTFSTTLLYVVIFWSFCGLDLELFFLSYLHFFSGNASEEQIESFLRGAEDESGRDSGTLAARVKKARQAAIVKKIEADMTEDEKLNEQDVQRKQLEKIFSLLNQHESDVGKMSENDLQNQLKMYKQ